MKLTILLISMLTVMVFITTAFADHGESHDDCPNLADDPEHPCWKIVRTCADDIVVRPIECTEVDDANKDYMHVMFVESSESRHSNNLSFNTITTAIYSPVMYPAVITIYVQDADMTPIGMMIFKTTLLEGITPIEFGFTEPIECHYNSKVHKPICNTDTPNTIHVNIFTDSRLLKPLAPEMTGIMA